MRLKVPPDWRRAWLLLGVAIGLLVLLAYKAAERYLWARCDRAYWRRVHERGSAGGEAEEPEGQQRPKRRRNQLSSASPVAVQVRFILTGGKC
jgi:hypothetical protein